MSNATAFYFIKFYSANEQNFTPVQRHLFVM